MQGAWLFTPHPCPNEGVLGYIRRLARENGYPAIGYLVPGRYGKATPGRILDVLDPMADRMHRTASDLIAEFPEKFNLAGRRICPHCWKETPLDRPAWEWKLSIACPQHRCYLVDRCPCCEQTWQGGLTHLSPCCEAYLRKCDPEIASENVLELMTKLSRAWETNDVPLPNQQAGLTWVEWTHLVQLVGGYATKATAPRPSRPAGLNELSEAKTVVLAAADALMNWPQGFKQFLDRHLRQDAGGALAPIGLKSAFGWFYKHLFVTLKGPGFEGLRAEFARHVSDQLPYLITRRNQLLLRYLDKPSNWSTVARVSRQIGRSKHRVACMVKAGTLDGVIWQSSSGRESILIRTREGVDPNPESDPLLTLTTVAIRFGIKKARVIQLIDAGLLQTAYGHNRLEQWAIFNSSIEHFWKRPKVLESQRRLVSLRQLIRYKLRTSEFVDLVRSVLEGELCLAIPPSERASDWAFDSDVVEEWLKTRRQTSAIGMTIPQAAIELGIKQQVVYHLVKIGLLESEKSSTNDVGRVITPSALESFKRDLTALAELAKFAKCSPRNMLVKLAEQGVLPVTGPSIDGGRQYYLRTRDIPPTLWPASNKTR